MTYLLLKNGERRYWNGNAYYRNGVLSFLVGADEYRKFYKGDIYYLSIDGYNVIDGGEELGDGKTSVGF